MESKDALYSGIRRGSLVGLLIAALSWALGSEGGPIEMALLTFAGAVVGFTWSLPWVGAAIFRTGSPAEEEE
ncbi:MAG: hypothetical protein QGI41_08640 [Acidimicrobiales bacterium]|jgi:hypothetical protein|nr:hypothetical protein [Acidimicrobiales bacterium]|tara:strand:+ start:2103 stop:2318 length:216 start_codon:yes stop_codon:yes gene_type:complete